MSGITLKRNKALAERSDAAPQWPIPLMLLVGVLSLLNVGCPSTLPYEASDRLVNELGTAQARQRLKETLLRSINPQMIEVEVTDDFFHYRYRHVIAGFPTGVILDNRIYFLNAVRVEAFQTNVVNIWTSAPHLIAQIIFGNGQDTRTFADLVTSFRARRGSSAR
jgi:hypothetical protein